MIFVVFKVVETAEVFIHEAASLKIGRVGEGGGPREPAKERTLAKV